MSFRLCSLIVNIFSFRNLIWNSSVPTGLPSNVMPYSSFEPLLSGCSLTLEVDNEYFPSGSVSSRSRSLASLFVLHLPSKIFVLSLRR